MGQQQLLLITLGVIIIGIAVVVGINLFNEHSIDQKRELLIAECVNLASMAQKYYKTPKEFGGGGRDFTNWTIHNLLKQSENGDFDFESESEIDKVIINAKGNVNVAGEDMVEVNITIFPDEYLVEIVK